MSESLRLSVTVVVNLALLVLSAVVPGQLEQTFPLGHGVLGVLLHLRVGLGVSQEVEVEAGLLVLGGTQQGHAHDLLVELQAALGRLHPEHGVVESVVTRVGGRADILVMATDELDPVSIGVLRERNVSHAAFGQLLLERVSGILDSLAGRLDVVHGDGNVSESTVRLGVSVHHAVVRVVLRAVVVGEFQDGVAVREVPVTTLQRVGAVVGEEVEGELGFGEVQMLDLVQSQKVVEFDCTTRKISMPTANN